MLCPLRQRWHHDGKEQVKALLRAPKNLGHRAVLAAMYATGLRVPEVTKLNVHELDHGRYLARITPLT